MEIISKIGRRKTAVARLYLSAGNGTVSINGRTLEDYFPSEIHKIIIKQPFVLIEADGKYDIKVNVSGGGFKGQAEAIRLAVSRALCELDVENRPPLKKEGFLTRDPRMVERKKYGRRKARKKLKFSKR